MNAILFENDDSGYLRWLASHPDGYVVNIHRRFDPGYVVLHRADCPTVSRYPDMERNPGGFTARNYRKVCGQSVREINLLLNELSGGKYAITSRACACLRRGV